MGCASCSSGGGTPRGCKNNGTCSSGGCDKLEVYDWLANMAQPAGHTAYDIVEVRFKNSRKGFYRNAKNIALQTGDVIAVEASPGHDIGVVSASGELARIQVAKKAPGLKPMETKKVYRIAVQEDIDNWSKARSLEKDVMFQSRTLALRLNLEMKISDVEFQGDLSKATFYYTAEGRVDFRQLIKDIADTFKTRVEMRQIGARQEAARLGGIGSCGRELCCSTWLTDFRSVSTSAARYQQLSLNPQKLAGQCGKLKCCLNFELDMYIDAMKAFPKPDTKLHTEIGSAYHVKTDVFKKQMWFGYEGGVQMGLIPLTPDRVREIMTMNKDGKKPADLKAFMEVVEVKAPDYTNVVGQDDLNRFDGLNTRSKNKRRKKKPNPNRPQNSRTEGGTDAPQVANKPKPNPNSKPNNRSRPNNGNKATNTPENKTPSASKEGESKPAKPRPQKPRRPNNNPNDAKNKSKEE
ncbi:MAG: cell fate regulator YaaT (PSP1 superfamily) [Lentimonas sp.]|jgi:cell fate regulator YaaT (PSP1 superfamily)